MNILVVEDDQALARILVKSIESNNHTVEVVHDGEAGLTKARSGRHDAIVLDLMLPRLSGIEVCRRLRADGNGVPVLMLTARSAVPERIEGLDAGADDYLVKPFSLGELQARLRALSRRELPARPEVIEAGRPDPRLRRPRRPGQRRAGRADRHRVRAARVPDAQLGRRSSRATSCARRYGARASSRRPTSSTSTSTTCAAS